jgi:cytosine/adenosine deaminase-related metal-dependent hydrolase
LAPIPEQPQALPARRRCRNGHSRRRRTRPVQRIAAVGRSLSAGGARVIDARGRIIMPGFVDTHHHLFETALHSFLADGLLFNDGKPHGLINYFEYILGRFAHVDRPQDV